MTDITSTVSLAESRLSPAKVLPSLLTATSNGDTFAPDLSAPEDDSTIKCLCGYTDDDGNTVFCELCKTWQHIECYYPEQDVPDVHECADCRPRSFDVKAAADRQKARREERFLLGERVDRRVKRPAAKSHKKKTRDSGQVNGWPPLDRADSSERQAGSPRDQPPPNKRPKTSHKSSASVPSINQIASSTNSRRKQNVASSAQSPVKSPPSTIDVYKGQLFSPQFMQLSQKPQYQTAESNSFSNLGLANDLLDWMRDGEMCKKATGIENNQAFMRTDLPYENFEAIFPKVEKQTEIDESVQINGSHPVFEYLTVQQDVLLGNAIGELKGQIGTVDDYISDPSNRWSTLRHPEPYVFFIPKLPIVLDAREEGNQLRFVRRSCKPNAKIQPIHAEKDASCRFLLISDADLNPGDEITIGWTVDPDVKKLLVTALQQTKTENFSFTPSEERVICIWISAVLANFGGCACRAPQSCIFNRFDRRSSQPHPELSNGMSVKPLRGRKGRKGINHASPLSTGHATNSRASSEQANNRQENSDDRADSRSVSGSARSKPTSRDNTPSISVDGVGLGVEMSEREQRKLQLLERRFQTLETDEVPAPLVKGKTKKRGSAGSALNANPIHLKSLPSMESPSTSPNISTLRTTKSTGTSTDSRRGMLTSRKTSSGSEQSNAVAKNEGRPCITRDENGAVVSERVLGPDSHMIDNATQTMDERWRVHFDQRLHDCGPQKHNLLEQQLNRGWMPGQAWRKPNPPLNGTRARLQNWPKQGLKPGQVVVSKGEHFARGLGPVYDFQKGWIYADDPEHPSRKRQKVSKVSSTSAAMPPPPKPSDVGLMRNETPAKIESPDPSISAGVDTSMADATATEEDSASTTKLEAQESDAMDVDTSTLQSLVAETAPQSTPVDNQESTTSKLDVSQSTPPPDRDLSPAPKSESVTAAPAAQGNEGSDATDVPAPSKPAGEASSTKSSPSWRPANLHVTLPPPPTFTGTAEVANMSSATHTVVHLNPLTPSSAATPFTPASMSGGAVAQSPMSTVSQSGLLSPAIANPMGTGPSPAKKKISFKDYSKRQAQQQATSSSATAAIKEGEDSPEGKKVAVDGTKAE